MPSSSPPPSTSFRDGAALDNDEACLVDQSTIQDDDPSNNVVIVAAAPDSAELSDFDTIRSLDIDGSASTAINIELSRMTAEEATAKFTGDDNKEYHAVLTS